MRRSVLHTLLVTCTWGGSSNATLDTAILSPNTSASPVLPLSTLRHSSFSAVGSGGGAGAGNTSSSGSSRTKKKMMQQRIRENLKPGLDFEQISNPSWHAQAQHSSTPSAAFPPPPEGAPANAKTNASPIPNAVPESIPADSQLQELSSFKNNDDAKGQLSHQMSQESFSKSLFTKTEDFKVGLQPTGSGGKDRVINNTSLSSNPYQASCMEIRLPQDNKPIQTRKKKLNFSKIRLEKMARAAAAAERQKLATEAGVGAKKKENAASSTGETGQEGEQEEDFNIACASTRNAYRSMGEMDTEDGAEIVMYYETSSDEGLTGFQYIATQVHGKQLPGRCENMTGYGFAMWIIPRQQYLDMLRSKPQLQAGFEGTPNKADVIREDMVTIETVDGLDPEEE